MGLMAVFAQVKREGRANQNVLGWVDDVVLKNDFENMGIEMSRITVQEKVGCLIWYFWEMSVSFHQLFWAMHQLCYHLTWPL